MSQVKAATKKTPPKNKAHKFMDALIIILVALMSVGANLPEEYAVVFDRRILLAGLIAIVVVSLIRYLKFTLVLVIGVLAVGANLPAQIAAEFNIDPRIMLFGLMFVVLISFANYVFNIPTGLEPSDRKIGGNHGVNALFSAIAKGRLSTVQTILRQGVDINIRTKTGQTPLMYAAYKGYGDIVQYLMSNGADIGAKDESGNTAMSLAEKKGHNRIVDLFQGSRAAAA